MVRVALSGLMALVLAGTGLAWVKLNQPVRTVRVVGELTPGEQNEIRTAIEASLGQGLLGINLASVQADIHSLSWPRKVTVRRAWPTALEIHVEKDLAVAVWGDAGYLTSDGRVMQFPDVAKGLPGFVCARSRPPEAMEVYGLLQQTLMNTNLQVSVLRESELGEWEVELDNGLRVLLGRQALADRMRRFSLAFEHELHDRFDMVRYVDARYANGVAVRWKETLVAPLVAYEEHTRYDI